MRFLLTCLKMNIPFTIFILGRKSKYTYSEIADVLSMSLLPDAAVESLQCFIDDLYLLHFHRLICVSAEFHLKLDDDLVLIYA